MTDKYLGFTYKGKKLNMETNADFKGFIENDGNDLSFFNTPDFSNEFANPQFGEKSYYIGNTKLNRTFSLKIQLDKITLKEYRDFLGWLDLDSSGLLIFDYNPNYGYDVKIQTISNSEFHVVPNCEEGQDEKYYIDLNVEFITIKDFAARWVHNVFWSDEDEQLINNDEEADFIEWTGNIATIKNNHNLKNYFIIEFEDDLTIRENNVVGENNVEGDILVEVTGTGEDRKYYSEFGVVIDADGNFIPCGPNSKIILNPKTEKILHFSKTTGIKIIPSSREVI